MKHHSRKTLYKGELYDSASEAHRAAELDLLLRAGKIAGWSRGVRQCVFDGGPGRKIFYTADFIVQTSATQAHAEEVKGVARAKSGRLILPRDLRIRMILWEAKFPNLPVRVVDRDGNEIWKLKGGRKS